MSLADAAATAAAAEAETGSNYGGSDGKEPNMSPAPAGGVVDIDEKAQEGVRQAEALTQTWSKGALRTIFVL